MNVLDLFSELAASASGLNEPECEPSRSARSTLRREPSSPSIGQTSPAPTTSPLENSTSGEADVICGGFPCQDISTAGAGAGLAGERSGLWRELLRAIRVVRPRYAIVENVAALLSRGMGTVLGDLAEIGYDAEWHCIPASAVGAPHRRDRVWIIADARGEQHEGDRPPLSGAIAEELFAANAYPDVQRADWPMAAKQSARWERQRRRENTTRGTGGNGSSCPPLADADDQRELQSQGRERDQRGWLSDSGQDVAHAERIGCQRSGRTNLSRSARRRASRSD
jgi:site-specific DNA-cytosine methylase